MSKTIERLHGELQQLIDQCVAMATDRKVIDALVARVAELEERLAVVERRVNQ